MTDDEFARGQLVARVDALMTWRDEAKPVLAEVPLLKQRMGLLWSIITALGAGVAGLAFKVVSGGFVP